MGMRFFPQYRSQYTRRMKANQMKKLLTTAAIPIFPMTEEVRTVVYLGG
jgi:hypothetical protein